MSLFGALFTAVSGMNAQSEATAAISNNIANVDTIGFKSSDAAFYSLVTGSSGGNYNSGTVTVNRVQNVRQEGTIQQTSSSTDAAIAGNGFFTVKQAQGSDQPYLYTRSGSFSEDSTGLLRNTAGMILYAWPLNSAGNIPSNSGDVSSLVAANVSFLGGLTKPTTTATMSLNLNADETNNNTEISATANTLPINPATTNANYTRGLTVYDSLGSAQNVTMQFRKIVGPMSSATGQAANLSLTSSLTDSTVFGNIHPGDSFTMKIGANSQKFVVGAAATSPAIRVDTIGDLVNNINNNFGATGNNGVATATLDGNGRLLIRADDPTQTLTMSNDTGFPLGNGTTFTTSTLNFATQTGSASTAYDLKTSGATGLSNTTALTSLAGVTAGNKFSVTVGGTSATYTVGSPASGTTVATVGDLITQMNTVFGTGGVINAAINANGALEVKTVDPTKSVTFADVAGTPTTGPNSLAFAGSTQNVLNYKPQASISTDDTYPGQTDFPTIANTTNPNTAGWWEVTVQKPDGTTLTQGMLNFNGSGALNAAQDANGNIGIDLHNINWGNGSDPSNISINIKSFTQYAGQYNVVSSDQNGAALGLRTGVEITKEGLVVAQFSNGATANLYKIPLSTFANPNGLKEESGTAYSETAASGTDNLREAGQGGAGLLTPDSLEGSNVDIATEFSNLIVTQRAYSANTRVVSTVDDMTQDLLRLL